MDAAPTDGRDTDETAGFSPKTVEKRMSAAERGHVARASIHTAVMNLSDKAPLAPAPVPTYLYARRQQGVSGERNHQQRACCVGGS
ncbi:hypothetical protein, partial [Klebsiella pneumoniae]|uniref:hypothetical protein n=1 Tax=Klebsiella pneumoniae TaxID=573 RepID=UPI0019533A13